MVRVWLKVYSPTTRSAPASIDGDQAGDHCVVRRGLSPFDGLLESNAVCPGMNGDVREPELLDAMLVTDAEIDSFRSAQVRGQPADEDVVFGCHGALDAASRGRGVFTDTQAFLCGAPKKCVAHDHLQGPPARQVADSLGKRNHFAESPSAFIAVEQMHFDGLFVGALESADPVVGKDCGVDGF